VWLERCGGDFRPVDTCVLDGFVMGCAMGFTPLFCQRF
jgi:hypothetical protein